MKLRITANTLVTKHFLEVDDQGVTYCETAAFGGTRRIQFKDITAIVKGADSGLSIQIGREIVKIPIKEAYAPHRAVIARLVSEVRRTARKSPSATAPAAASEA